jgi:hypothetical protein
MLATFTKIGGIIQGFLFKPTLESLEDGRYVFEIERVDREKRSKAANRLMFGALVNELARFKREEGNGLNLPPAYWHGKLKEECLHVLSEREREKVKTRWAVGSDGKRVTWRELDGKYWEPFTSTTQLNSKQFSEYLSLAAAVAQQRHGYPYEFDFLTA